MVRVLKLGRVFDTQTGRFIKDFAKIGLPAFKRDTEDLMGGVGKRKIGLGFEQPEIELETQGDDELLVRYFGSEAGIRIVGSYQGTNGRAEIREIVARGEIFEHGRGDMEIEKKEFNAKPKLTCTYYKETLNNTTIFEYDWENEIVIVNGVDVFAQHRQNVA